MPPTRCSRGTASPRPFAGKTSAALTAAFVAIWPAASAKAGELHVAIAEVPCPNHDQFGRQIERAAEPFMARNPDLMLLLGTDAAGQVVLRLLGPGASYSLRIPFNSADCPALPMTVVLLVRSWLNRDWGEPVPVPSGPAQPEPVSEPPPAPPSPPKEPALTFIATGGAFLSLGSAGSGPTLSAGADLAVGERTWGATALGTYHTAVSLGSGSGQLSARLLGLAAAARLRIRATPAGRVDLLLGPAFTAMSGTSSGYWRNLSILQPDVAAFASVRWSLRIVGALAWVSSLDLWSRLHAETFRAEGAPQPLRVGRNRLLLQTGLGFGAF